MIRGRVVEGVVGKVELRFPLAALSLPQLSLASASVCNYLYLGLI